MPEYDQLVLSEEGALELLSASIVEIQSYQFDRMPMDPEKCFGVIV